MGKPATLPAEPGAKQQVTDMCILDVVKHALRTIINCLNVEDRLAVVTFSNHAKVESDLTYMDEAGRRTVHAIVRRLWPAGISNLWDGLKMGMDLLHPTAHVSLAADGRIQASPSSEPLGNNIQRVASVFLLTDGAPNVTPTRGHIARLQSYLAANRLSTFSINTFGFGYELNSQLLFHIAEVGCGSYTFIPDLGFMGTAFVHALANTLATFAVRCNIQVVYDAGLVELSVLGDPFVEFARGSRVEPELANVLELRVGDLQYGQSRDFVLIAKPLKPFGADTSESPLLTILGISQPWNRDSPLTATATISASQLFGAAADPAVSRLLNEVQRISFASTLLSFFGHDHNSDLVLQTTPPSAPSRDSPGFVAFEGLVQKLVDERHPAAADAEGQVRVALETAHWNRWGRHYLPSLACAHLRQRCGNFRDEGQLVYGSNSLLFVEERDKAHEQFNKLPAARPATPPPDNTGWSPRARRRHGRGLTKVTDMSVWNSRIGPCFAGSCHVKLPGSGSMRVDQLTRGTLISTPVGPRAVVAVVRTRTFGYTPLCALGEGLLVTPWHPIFIDDHWRFPIELVSPIQIAADECDAVYSVLLEPSSDTNSHAVWVSDVLCVTLGSGALDRVRYHPFLTNYDRVLDNLMRLPGWHHSTGILQCTGTLRSHPEGLVCGFYADDTSASSGDHREQPSTPISVIPVQS
ncbi:hypothetical protein AURDEDRAFT_182079 [Auricularia subglabra TFB-10046 SS5]|nr:hypothetical protein AURDEDRAFT_182079 [Auricularia subglabra TFB-10046 SS5]